ncbi:hypothetical protein HK099_003941 [Clydaea vesicula]|uniref:cystathionine gamma-lyase n=1 Tax=Clydaea vesicula TaxID=447962 RepID=A0AAD5XVY7_9FUNG|nr:hypothetical protein HK099_003941 [Clydaea vesicula]
MGRINYEGLGFFGTKAIHAGQEPDVATGAVIPAISLSTTFAQTSAGNPISTFDYSRSGNPNRNNFETAVAALEHGRFALAFSSGSAVTAAVTTMVTSGSHIISVNDVYGGTSRYFRKVANRSNIEVDFVDLNDPNNIKGHLKPNTKFVWIETPTNPTLRLVDIKAVADIVHQQPGNPLLLGADIVVHSVTKFINGHSDVVMGIAVTNNEQYFEELKFLQNSSGACPRMKKHEENALEVAKYLENSSFISEVIYPGLPSHKQHNLAKSQMHGFGGMLSFRLKNGNLSSSNKFLQNLKLFTLAESLGGVESLVELPAVMTHAALTAEARNTLGITDSLVRMSVGIEDSVDLINDIASALNAVFVKKD